MSKFKVGLVQNSAGNDMAANLSNAEVMVKEAVSLGANLVITPEYFSCLALEGEILLVGEKTEAEHPAIAWGKDLAKELNIWFLMGSLAISAPNGKIYNRSYLISPQGEIANRYDKIHMFDIQIDEDEWYRESATIEPGDQAVNADLPWGQMGLSICYDLRFPNLYNALADSGALALAIPAAFTETTGKAHWHALCRARAIETGSYVFAACQCGGHGGDKRSYGHSLIIDPWGKILAEGGEEPTVVVADVDANQASEARRKIPALEHRRSFALPEQKAMAAE